jgi:hypothetical protein
MTTLTLIAAVSEASAAILESRIMECLPEKCTKNIMNTACRLQA